jgi:hypothetical protein
MHILIFITWREKQLKTIFLYQPHRDIADGYHFIYVCEKYEDIRKMYSKAHYRRHPSVFKLIQLLSVHNKKELKIILENWLLLEKKWFFCELLYPAPPLLSLVLVVHFNCCCIQYGYIAKIYWNAYKMYCLWNKDLLLNIIVVHS